MSSSHMGNQERIAETQSAQSSYIEEDDTRDIHERVMYERGRKINEAVVGPEGFEPPTPSSEDWCSIH